MANHVITDIVSTITGKSQIIVNDGVIIIKASKGSYVSVFSAVGIMIKSLETEQSETSFILPSGIYILDMDGETRIVVLCS